MRFIFIVYNTTYKNNKQLIYRTGLKWCRVFSCPWLAHSLPSVVSYTSSLTCAFENLADGVTGFNCSKWSRLMSFYFFSLSSFSSFPFHSCKMITLLVTLRELPSFNHQTVMSFDYTVPRADGGNTLIYIQRNTRLLRLHYNLSLNIATTESARLQTQRVLSPRLDPTLSRTDFYSEKVRTKF